MKVWLPTYVIEVSLLIPGQRQSKAVTDFYDRFKGALGKVDKSFEDSVEEETQSLLHLDDILSEIAMIRRVQEDIRLVCMDCCDYRSDILPLDRWAERSKSKLKRLEDDASRIRKSVWFAQPSIPTYYPHIEHMHMNRFGTS